MKIIKTAGFYESFDRSGQPTRDTHYCAGCGHGIAHKLITEALVELGLQDRTIMVNPIGCAVFGYYYWDVGNIGAAHGRAPAVATALKRTLKDAVIIAYQGDGDLGAIGFNCTFQAASRGEHMVTFFINNATYGMTGGQMAPTTLLGQKTATSPYGRNARNDGYPLRVCEVLSQLQAPVYIERCSLADPRRVMQARKAIRKALEIQRDGKGYAFVELLSPCPVNMNMTSIQCAKFVTEQMEPAFPLGVFRDETAQAQPDPAQPAKPSVEAFFNDSTTKGAHAQVDTSTRELRLKFSGFGGQGILSLGLCVAEAGRCSGKFTTWLPSYGPEQRGGSASCSVVISGTPVGSPAVDHPDVLVCMNQPSYERFAPTVKSGGTIIYDSLIPTGGIPLEAGVKTIAVPAMELATRQGVPKAANTVMLAALTHINALQLPETEILWAMNESFKKKPLLIDKNQAIFQSGVEWCRDNLK